MPRSKAFAALRPSFPAPHQPSRRPVVRNGTSPPRPVTTGRPRPGLPAHRWHTAVWPSANPHRRGVTRRYPSSRRGLGQYRFPTRAVKVRQAVPHPMQVGRVDRREARGNDERSVHRGRLLETKATETTTRHCRPRAPQRHRGRSRKSYSPRAVASQRAQERAQTERRTRASIHVREGAHYGGFIEPVPISLTQLQN